MADTNINVIFSNQAAGGSEADPEVPGVTPNPESPELVQEKPKEKSKALTMTKAMALYVGKQALNMATSRVGAITRSTVKQEQTNAALKVMGYGASFMGAIATGNPMMAIMSFMSMGVDIISSTIDFNHNREKESVTTAVMLQRTGSKNRSR